MTDPRERLADLLKRSPQMYRPASMRLADVDAILSALHLTPAAALALMEMRATVVPVRVPKTVRLPELSIELYERYPEMSAQSHEQHVKEYARLALAASPYREKADD